MDAIKEVAEAAAKRKEQIREWAKARIDEDKAVTPIDDPLPKDPSPEEVQKVNMQGADETLGGPANEEATEKGAAPTYEDADDVTAKAEENYPGDEQGASVEAAKSAALEGEPEGEGDSSGGGVSDEEDGDSAAEEEAPAKSAKKDEWIAYRVKTHGLTEEEAEAKTKEELIDLK